MKQRGQVLLLLIVLMASAGIAIFFTYLPGTRSRLQGEERTQKILSSAKVALIGFAASSPTRPGQLPCPDMNNDGLAEAPDSAGCPSGNIGRLPWKTLGLEDGRDSAAERLWYAASPNFTRNTTSCCLDVDSKGTLTVSQDKAATVITTEAVAVIFAPGPSLAGQLRNTANENNPANYLDTTDGVSNAVMSAFIAAPDWNTLPQSPTPTPFNDRLVIVNTEALWTVVERRVGREMVALLKAYRNASACNCYPWAANDFDDDSVNSQLAGMVPIEVALPETWGSLGITVPSYMIGSNEWGKRFFYTVAETQSAAHGANTLTVDGVNKDFVVITPGPAGASRPSTNLADYIEDAENRDHGRVFITPTSTAYARDRIYFCPGTAGIC